MKPEDLMRAIGEAMREPDLLDDPRLRQLAAGELDASQIEALRQELAAAGEPEDLPEDLIEALRPFAKPTQTRLAEAMRAAVTPAAPKPRPRRRLAFRWLAPPALVAAAAGLLVALWPATQPLPAYRLELVGGEQGQRSTVSGATEPLPVVTPSSRIELHLRPATRSQEPVALRAFVAPEAGRAKQLDLAFEVSESGTILVEGRVGDLLRVEPGVVDLVLVVVAASDAAGVPATVDEIERHSARWQVFTQRLRIVAE